MVYLSIVACFKNEAPYLQEWIEFHRLVGVERFYLYNNASSDDPEKVLRPYIESGIAKVFTTDMEACQLPCYFNALQAFANQSRFMAFIDVDEFLFCPGGQDLREFLPEFEPYPVLGVGWVIFGSSGHKSKPAGLTIENYTRCAERSFGPHRHIKSIVNPLQVYCPMNAHCFIPWQPRFPPVDEKHIELQGALRHSSAAWTVDRIRLNHYFTRSWDEWRNHKRAKGKADHPTDHPAYFRPDEDFTKHDRNELEDTTILRYLPELKRRLHIG